MTKLFDIACNFTSERFDSDLDDVISSAINNNVDKFLVVSAELDDTKKIQEIKHKYPENCLITLGVHPHHAKTFNDKSSMIMDTYIKDINPNSIGETGLDFFRNISSYDEQIYAFNEQIKLAIKFNKPLFLHQRESHEDFIKVLKNYTVDLPPCVVHCFTGTQDELDAYLELDFFIGLTGWICDERRNKDLRSSIKNIPLDKLMIETDCPYLIPRNLKIKNNRNEPKHLPHIANEISLLMDIPSDEIISRTYNNSIRFFN
jgi:TatD DNase family protein